MRDESSISPGQPTVYTIGHSNHSFERFLALLQEHGIQVLIDTRSSPYSRYAPHFGEGSLKQTLPEAGIRYVFMGRELGGRPEGEEFYDDEGYVLYGKIADSGPFQTGIERVSRGLERYRVALMCSEEDPAVCHRHLLVSRVLSERGIDVQHIRGDGAVQSEEALLRTKEIEEASPQLALFEFEEKQEWKSLRSVSDRREPRSSSGS